MLNFGGTDAERQCGKRAVRTGMRVAAHHGHAGQGRALLGADHMHDALAQISHLEFGDAQLGAVLIQRFHLQA